MQTECLVSYCFCAYVVAAAAAVACRWRLRSREETHVYALLWTATRTGIWMTGGSDGKGLKPATEQRVNGVLMIIVWQPHAAARLVDVRRTPEICHFAAGNHTGTRTAVQPIRNYHTRRGAGELRRRTEAVTVACRWLHPVVAFVGSAEAAKDSP